MYRLAVLADVHGNLPALEAVLADIQSAGVDQVVVNGDLADGPFPRETLDCLTGLGNKAVWLRGNSDRWLVETYDGHFRHPDSMTDSILAWAAQRITRDQRDRLAALPLTHLSEVSGFGRIGFCHATGRSDNEMFLVDSPFEHAAAAFASIAADTVVISHSHMPFDRLFDRVRIVNTGSVGMAYGHVGASWLLIDGGMTLRRTRYDVERASKRIAASGMPHAAEFAATYVEVSESDVEALAAFHEIRERQQATGKFDDPG